LKDKVLIANRGEIALRIMEACKDLGLDYVVIYTDADKESEHVQRNIDSGGNKRQAWRVSSYTDPNDILAVADHTKCTAIHPGYGFFSEDFRFARRVTVRNRPLTFIGPKWEVVKDLGDKINTKRVANELGIPTIPGTDGPIYNEMEAEDVARHLLDDQLERKIKNPSILVKAAAGGGGMGIEEVYQIEHFRRIYRQVQNYAKRQFGDGGVLIEQCIRDFNHLEVQLVCSRHGERVHFGTRNCTIQSTGRQKRLEAAPGFDDSCFVYDFNGQEVLDKVVEYSLKLASHVRYDNVGTWEWIVTREGQPYLLEVNTRIQVENDVSARVSYLNKKHPNLIREQIRLALISSSGSWPRIPIVVLPHGSVPSPNFHFRSMTGLLFTVMCPRIGPMLFPAILIPTWPLLWSGAIPWLRLRSAAGDSWPKWPLRAAMLPVTRL
jgi:acetyl/propionyl-CoA carboxylase alpha subunit